MGTSSAERSGVQVVCAAGADEHARMAARELAGALAAMIGSAVEPRESAELSERELRITYDRAGYDAARAAGIGAPAPLAGANDSFAAEPLAGALRLVGSSGRALIHAQSDLLERLGATYAAGYSARFPRIAPERLGAGLARLGAFTVVPAFRRRACASDLMTWHYGSPERLELHLAHDREFIPWMARRGLNAFSFIRHARDSRLAIDELSPLYRSYCIDQEYGGHVLQLLLPRGSFGSHPEYFPQGRGGQRMERGNLCASSRAALALVRDGALDYTVRYPENRLLHIWGADVWEGAWCECERCAGFPPQLQYMKVVNEIAAALAERPGAPAIAYLAYHDTIEPDPHLAPLKNVWFEWAPRERCYSHAIDDPACGTNPRYYESLKRYLGLFDGRGHVFEYYADAILFGGLGFATPAIIARDLRAYRALGIAGVSNLTFGAFSVLAYPVNLEAFARASRSPDFDPAESLTDTAAARHPACSSEMAAAYRAIERASRLVLDYGDVMRPLMTGEKALRKRGELGSAAREFRAAAEAAEAVMRKCEAPARAERGLWSYSAEVLEGISEYLAARELEGGERRVRGDAAIGKIGAAIEHLRAVEAEARGTWGAYDLERIREIWLEALRRRLDAGAAIRERG